MDANKEDVMSLFEELAPFGIVIIVCAVCLCAHYLQQIAKKVCGSERKGETGCAGYARK